MKLAPTPIRLAIAAAFGVAMMPAQAALISSQTLNLNMSGGPVVDNCGPVNSASCNNGSTPLVVAPQGVTSFDKFDSSTGVLTGVTIGLSSTRTQTISGSVTNPTTKGKSANGTTSTASGSSGASLSAGGVTTAPLGAISHSANSAEGGTAIAPSKTAGTATNASLTVNNAGLNSYVGAGTVAVTSTLTDVQATSTFSSGAKDSTSSSATYSVEWTGKLTTEYTYLLHAAPSFEGGSSVLTLTLDFGTFFVGEADGLLDFSLFNLAGDRVGLDLDSFDAFSGPFGSNLASFLALAAGSSHGPYSVTFDTANVGSFAQSYRLLFSDEDVGASSTRQNYELTLNVTGEVLARPTNGVPEPSLTALLGAGFAGVSFAVRRRRRG